MNLLIILLVSFWRYYLSLRYKYSLQNLVLRHPQSVYEMFFWGERPSFTSIVYNTSNIIILYMYMNFYISAYEWGNVKYSELKYN
jgi:hypothetical protein